MVDLNKEIQYIKGVGPNRVKLLNKLGIYTLGDIITYFPNDFSLYFFYSFHNMIYKII